MQHDKCLNHSCPAFISWNSIVLFYFFILFFILEKAIALYFIFKLVKLEEKKKPARNMSFKNKHCQIN